MRGIIVFLSTIIGLIIIIWAQGHIISNIKRELDNLQLQLRFTKEDLDRLKNRIEKTHSINH